MRKFVLAITAALLVGGSVWAADVAVDGGGSYAGPGLTEPASLNPATMELMWDNGLRRWSIAWYTGADTWYSGPGSSCT